MQEDVFLREFDLLFRRYQRVLTLDVAGEGCVELMRINDAPCVALDRMISAARLALLEIENSAQRQKEGRKYYQQVCSRDLTYT